MSESLGAFIRKLDSNNRLGMPDQLLKRYPRSLTLTLGFDNCVRGYSPQQWDTFDAKLRGLDPDDPDEGDLLRLFRSSAVTVELDTSGRFRFPDVLMKWAGLEEDHREVQVYDLGDRLEFWEVGRWNEFMSDRSPALKDLARRVFGTQRSDSHEERTDDAGS